MNTHSLCCIGYITQDKVVTPKNTIYMPGGTSFYFAHAIKHLNANDFLLVTALADTDMGIVEDIRKEGISVKALHSTHSVCFENIYGENQNERTQRVTAKADPFTVEGLKDTDARIIHLGSLLADDFSLEVIKFLSGKGLLSVDVQGFLRKVENEKVLAVDWPEKKEALKYIHILKANEAEMEVLTGCSEPHEAALLIADWGVKEVLDDFGTGYSSLNCIKEMPLNTIKIDKSFIDDIAKNPDTAVFVKMIVNLSHDLHIAVCAEGVEEQVQFDILRDLETDVIQGYYFGRPMPSDKFEEKFLSEKLQSVK